LKLIHQFTKSPSHQLLVLVIVTVLAYANSFRVGFALDNKALILDDARVHTATRENVALILGPLSTEAVTNVVGRADLLAAFGVLGALLSSRDRAWMHGHHEMSRARRGRTGL